jgi:hypothetical protein
MRLAVDPSALRWGHGDGLVLRGLSELPVVLGSPSAASPPTECPPNRSATDTR